jgi:hypothetical protein
LGDEFNCKRDHPDAQPLPACRAIAAHCNAIADAAGFANTYSDSYPYAEADRHEHAGPADEYNRPAYTYADQHQPARSNADTHAHSYADSDWPGDQYTDPDRYPDAVLDPARPGRLPWMGWGF